MFAMPIAIHHLTIVMSCSMKKHCGRMRNGFIITSSALAVNVARDKHDEFFFQFKPTLSCCFLLSCYDLLLSVISFFFAFFILVIRLWLWTLLLSSFLLHCFLMTCCAIRNEPTNGTMLWKWWDGGRENGGGRGGCELKSYWASPWMLWRFHSMSPAI